MTVLIVPNYLELKDFNGLVLDLGTLDQPLHLVIEGGVPREQRLLKGHLPKVIYHQEYQYTKEKEHTPGQIQCY